MECTDGVSCSKCTSDKYIDSTTKLCKPCNTGCTTCENGNVNNNCLSCTLPKYLEPTSKKCVDNCNVG